MEFAKSVEVICDMLIDRGYTKPIYDVKAPPTTITTSKTLTSGKTKTIRIKWMLDVKINKDAIQKLIDEMESSRIFHFILIISETISPQSQTMLKSLKQQDKLIEIFEYGRTMFNPTKHKLVPKHMLCPSSAVDVICKDWGCIPSNLPRINTSDPIVKWFGGQPGQLMKILRPSEVLGGKEVILYRIIVA